jgi:hypothetical protein
MRNTLLLFFLLLTGVIDAKQDPPDSLAVSKLYSTSWKPTVRYKPSGLFRRLKKVSQPSSVVRITIYSDEFHTFTSTGVTQICSSRHRNQNEFWLDCKEPDQFIYRVISIDGDVLIMDQLARPTGKTTYVRVSRNHYTRTRN